MESPKEINQRWWHRRTMAWLCIAYLVLLVPMLAFFQKYGLGDKWLAALQPVLIAIIGANVAVLGAYIGFSTHDDVKTRNNGESDV